MSKSEVRSSQLLTTFGAGAMMDQPEGSVIIGGLDHWRYQSGPIPIVDEPRLLAKLRARLERDDLTLRTPPPSTDDPTAGKPGITVFRFPRCFLVQKPEARLDAQGKALPESKGTRRQIVPQSQLTNGKFSDGGLKHEVVPLRFVRACEHGHLGDIDWPAFVHGGSGACGAPIYLEEKSTTGALVDVEVSCSGCGLRRSLAQAAVKGSKALGRCDGLRPWLGSYTREACTCHSRLLIRSASNAYFSQTISVISIPDKKSPVDEVVQQLWDSGLSVVATNPANLAVVRLIPNVAARLAGISDAEVLAGVKRVAAGVAQFVERPVKEVEYEAFAEALDELGADQPDGDFFARNLAKEHWIAAWMQGITNVVLVHRLREVIAQVAFTRFESLGADINGELPDEEISLKVQPAAIALEANWLFHVDVPRRANDTSSADAIVMRYAQDFRERHWPWTPFPEVYYDPRALETDSKVRASLHAKIVAVDRRKIFITSANFTEAAQQRNIEMGLLCAVPYLAERVCSYFEGLRNSGQLVRLAIKP